jgi:outer membrane protein assembly factor BamB
VWFNPKMKIQHADAVRVGDWVYGSSGDFGPSFLGCVNAKTGEFGWRQRGIAKANVLYADGKLIVLDEDGALYLVKADPAKYRLLGKAAGVCKKTAWTVPTLVGRTLYLRDREKIVALDLGTTKSST